MCFLKKISTLTAGGLPASYQTVGFDSGFALWPVRRKWDFLGFTLRLTLRQFIDSFI
jgi:hypothetical protein